MFSPAWVIFWGETAVKNILINGEHFNIGENATFEMKWAVRKVVF